MREVLLIALGWLVALPALADVAPPTPEEMECPRGAVGRVEAGEERGWSAWCAPSTCASDDECEEGRVCSAEPIGLCVEDRGGHRNARDRGCEPGGTCLNIHSTCESSRRCVRPAPGAAAVDEVPDHPVEEPEEVEAPPPPEAPAADVTTPPVGCGCHVASTPATPTLLLGLLGWLAIRRR